MVKVIVGLMGSSVANGAKALSTPAQVSTFLDVCSEYGVKELDTARVYNGGKSEELLGQVKACDRFNVSTKAPGFSPGSLSYERITAANKASMAALQTDCVDIYYIHGPDRTVALEDACRAINDAHQRGTFKRFGVSNLSDDEVQRIYDICKSNNYILPSVYQGGYSALHRKAEKTLFPLLRSLNMSFYAFSPFAGGILAKQIDEIISPTADSRFAQMPVFAELFVKKEIIDALRTLQKQCESQGTTVRQATIAWCKHHSPLQSQDGVIWGASSTQQLESTLKTWKEAKPLDQSLASAFEQMWKDVESVAPGYHS